MRPVGTRWINPLHPQRSGLLPLWLGTHCPLQIFWVMQASSKHSFAGYKQIARAQQKVLPQLRAACSEVLQNIRESQGFFFPPAKENMR